MQEALTHFWTPDRVLLIIIFAIGIIAGAYITNQYVDPYLNASTFSDYNSTMQLNTRLSERNDQLFSCLELNGINPDSCS